MLATPAEQARTPDRIFRAERILLSALGRGGTVGGRGEATAMHHCGSLRLVLREAGALNQHQDQPQVMKVE